RTAATSATPAASASPSHALRQRVTTTTHASKATEEARIAVVLPHAQSIATGSAMAAYAPTKLRFPMVETGLRSVLHGIGRPSASSTASPETAEATATIAITRRRASPLRTARAAVKNRMATAP